MFPMMVILMKRDRSCTMKRDVQGGMTKMKIATDNLLQQRNHKRSINKLI